MKYNALFGEYNLLTVSGLMDQFASRRAPELVKDNALSDDV
jgi:hypothetical protein